jgi:hypothetical protein
MLRVEQCGTEICSSGGGGSTRTNNNNAILILSTKAFHTPLCHTILLELLLQAADFLADDDGVSIFVYGLVDRMFPHDHEHPPISAHVWDKSYGREYHLRSRVVPAPCKRQRTLRNGISSSSCRFCETRQAANGKVHLLNTIEYFLADLRALWCYIVMYSVAVIRLMLKESSYKLEMAATHPLAHEPLYILEICSGRLSRSIRALLRNCTFNDQRCTVHNQLSTVSHIETA